MTIDELSKLMRDEFAKVNDRLDQFGQRMAGVEARTETKSEQHTNEIGTLFELHGRHSERLTTIEKDYVPRSEFSRHQDENREEHQKFSADNSDAKNALAKFGALLAIVLVVIEIAAKYLLKG